MSENNTYKNIPILNSLRFFAAFSVCIFHFVCTTNGLIFNKIALSFFDNGRYGVQMFFVISGFVIPWSMYNANYKLKNIFSFLLKRLIRLEPSYVVSIIFTIFIILTLRLLLNIYDAEFSFMQIILHLGYLIPFSVGYKWINEVYWTLAIEFQYYILISLLFPLFMKSNSVYRYLLYFLFLTLGINSNGAFLPHWLPNFLMGITLFLKMINKIKFIEFYSFLILSCIWSLYFQSIGSCLYSLATVLIILLFNKTNLKIPSFLGEFSYSVYLIHNFTGAILINILSIYAVQVWQKMILLIFAVIITYSLAWGMYNTIEKPSKKWSSKIKFR